MERVAPAGSGNVDGVVRCWHGTSSGAWASAGEAGVLRGVYVTWDEDIAAYYADLAVDEDGTEKVLLELDVPVELLRYDSAAMDEPVLVDDDVRDAAWDAAAAAHPDWLSGELILVPEHAWEVSRDGASSARVAGDLPVGVAVRVVRLY